MKYAYYPGCSQESTSKEYNLSALEVCKVLGIDLVEIPGWNCCGASSGHSLDYWLSHSLVGRNLALAEKQGLDVAVICPACYLRLRNTQHECNNDARLKEKLPELIDMPYESKYDIRHVLEIISSIVGVDKVKEKVKKPLKGLKVVSYYGCYLVRPPRLAKFDDPENPQSMDKLMSAVGAEALDWRAKVDCCGGSLSLTNRDIVAKLVSEICDAAREVGAEAIVTACGLCHANLEMRQGTKNSLPVFYFTELLGVAFGLNARPWLQKHLINPFALLEKHGLI